MIGMSSIRFSSHPSILRIALTGTPGCGKTSVSKILEQKGFCVLHLTEFIQNQNVSVDFDNERSCLIVDMDDLEFHICAYEARLCGMADSSALFSSADNAYVLIIESHMAHHICDISFVLRTNPLHLPERLKDRNYSDQKIEENCAAEELDVILCESYEWCKSAFEIDTTEKSIKEVAETVESLICLICQNRDLFLRDDKSAYTHPLFPKSCLPGTVNWINSDEYNK